MDTKYKKVRRGMNMITENVAYLPILVITLIVATIGYAVTLFFEVGALAFTLGLFVVIALLTLHNTISLPIIMTGLRVGILFAIIAMVVWAICDFTIQIFEEQLWLIQRK